MDFTNANLSGAYFEIANLANANLSNANIAGARFIDSFADFAIFAGADARGAEFDVATLESANFTGADARGAGFLDGIPASALTTNLIRPDGHITGLDLNGGGLLVARNYHGNPLLPIHVDGHFVMSAGGVLKTLFEADAWHSTISFAAGIPVSLGGGTLDLEFADGVDLVNQIGRTFDVFNWTGVTPSGTFDVESPYTWDLSNLYTTGNVTLLAVPEPSAFLLASLAGAALFAQWLKRTGTSRTVTNFTFHANRASAALSILVLFLVICPSSRAATLLNDSWADGDSTNTNLPTDSAVYAGLFPGGSVTDSPGKLAFVQTNGNLQLWTFFTADNSVSDGNQPHNNALQMNVGDTLTASLTLQIPNPGPTLVANTNLNFRFGLFFDPTDARLQTDNGNTDGGGPGNTWQDATGYILKMPINGSSSGNSPLALAKRIVDGASLLGSSSFYDVANGGGSSFALAANTSYTFQLSLSEVSTSQMDVTATIIRISNSAVLSTVTRSDTGSAFGGALVAGSPLLPGSSGIYTQFDELNLRISDDSQALEYDFTNFSITLVPEPPTLLLAAIGVVVIPGLGSAKSIFIGNPGEYDAS